MARSKGYRTRPEHAEEMRGLRKSLGLLTGAEWQKAQSTMQRIAWLSGNKHGPSRGLVMPRCCAVCNHFGHTKQYCPVERERQQRILDDEIAAERQRCMGRPREGLAAYFDECGFPYVWGVEGGGAVLDYEEGGPHAGLWTWRGNLVVKRTEMARVE